MAAQEIRDHLARAKRAPTTQNLETLWRAVFMLQAWYFLPATDAEGPSHPSVTLVEGQAWLLAFTNVRRVKEFARAAKRVNTKDEMFLLVLDPLQSIERIREAGEHIEGVIFNIGSDETFRTTTEALEGFARHFGLPLS
ncbi:MAG: hypothetical protein H0U74_06605 [Bradymonadaceae bacterium]|nr:hypothetical protein [Lujinxingiaceae bacterium]